VALSSDESPLDLTKNVRDLSMASEDLKIVLSKSAVQRALARDLPGELDARTLMAAGKAGLLDVDIQESKQGYRTFARLQGRGEVWDRARAALTQVRREMNLSVDWLSIGKNAVKVEGSYRRWSLVWNEGESPTVLRGVAAAMVEKLAEAN
jgi:hypothetical protein